MIHLNVFIVIQSVVLLANGLLFSLIKVFPEHIFPVLYSSEKADESVINASMGVGLWMMFAAFTSWNIA
jgi:hypothetical protein